MHQTLHVTHPWGNQNTECSSSKFSYSAENFLTNTHQTYLVSYWKKSGAKSSIFMAFSRLSFLSTAFTYFPWYLKLWKKCSKFGTNKTYATGNRQSTEESETAGSKKKKTKKKRRNFFKLQAGLHSGPSSNSSFIQVSLISLPDSFFRSSDEPGSQYEKCRECRERVSQFCTLCLLLIATNLSQRRAVCLMSRKYDKTVCMRRDVMKGAVSSSPADTPTLLGDTEIRQ